MTPARRHDMEETAAVGSPRGLEGLRSLVRLIDEAFRIPGTSIRLGLDSLIGLIPGIGDISGAVISGYVLLAAVRMGTPVPVLLHMLLNIGVDALVGMIPLLGDLFDVGWKANRRNLQLLERFTAQPATTRRRSLGVMVGAAALLIGLLVGVVWLAIVVVGSLLSALKG